MNKRQKARRDFKIFATSQRDIYYKANYNPFSWCSHLWDNDIFCFSDVTQSVRNIFMQNDSRPCPSLHGHHSTSLTMPQGKITVKTSKDTLLSYMQLLLLRQRDHVCACMNCTNCTELKWSHKMRWQL